MQRKQQFPPRLTAEEELELAERIRDGDVAARSRLILANLRLAVTIARRYRGRDVSLDDLVQEGTLGLIRASQDFDPARGRFGDYAALWIRAFVRRALRRNQPASPGMASLQGAAFEPPARSEAEDPRPSLLALAAEHLNPVEAWILQRRYGLEDDRPATYAELEAECGLSPHRLRQVVARALDRMREILRQMEAA